jgi:excinuclease ABC subunit C
VQHYLFSGGEVILTENNPKLRELREKAMKLPLNPGVYLMHDKTGKIIYVGKAKALKNRVSQYFGSDRNHQEKVIRMVLNVDDFDYIVTDSEFEALVLENTLIKQYMPKYNILLKDAKGYSYIRISRGPWARISEAKKILDDGAKYIGPYMSSDSVKKTVDEAQKIFRLPNCNRKFPQEFGKGRPCLSYYIEQCSAPCRGRMSEAEYDETVDEAVSFITGGSGNSIKMLTERMLKASDNLDFELAAKIRDRIEAVKKISEKQKVVESRIREQDVIALAMSSGTSAVSILQFRDGHLYDRADFFFDDAANENELRNGFIKRYYMENDVKIPPVITVDGKIEDRELMEQMLSGRCGRRVRFNIPQKGEQYELVKLCKKNAAEKLSEHEGRKRTGREVSALDEVGRLLGLPKPPEYIESYDISNIAGSDNVAGMVVFENARPLKSAYRKFEIKSVTGQDDYASMREVIRRRFEEYEKHKDENEGFGRLPDLILLDGGKGHVDAVKPLLDEMKIEVPLFGMVKDDKHRTRAIAVSGGEIAINSTRSAFTLISTIQEEVHRFAIGYHRQHRKKHNISTTLTSIEGIGETRARALMKHFRTIEAISEADITELKNAPGMTEPAADSVWAYFHEKDRNGQKSDDSSATKT